MENQKHPLAQNCIKGTAWQGLRLLALLTAGLLAAGCAQLPPHSAIGEGARGAVEAAKTAVISPRSLSGSYLVGTQAMRQFDTAIAQQHIDFVLKSEPANRDVLTKAFAVSFDNGAFNRAFALARLADIEGQRNPLIAIALAVEDISRRDYGAAAARLTNLPNSAVNRAVGPLLLAWVKFGQGALVEVEETLQALDTIRGFSALTNLHRALIFGSAGQHQAAVDYFRAAGAHKPDSVLRLSLALATEFARNGNTDASVALIQLRQDALLDRPQVLANIQAIKEGSAGLSVTDGAAEVLFDIASALHRERQNGSALFFAKLAIYLNPQQALGHLLVGEIFEDRKQLDQALDAYQAVRVTSPFRLMANLRRAETLDARGDKQAATDVLTALVKSQAANPEPAIRLGDLYRRSEDWRPAIAAYDTAIDRLARQKQADWSVYYARGIALERAKLWQRAEDDFLRALKLSPDQPYVMNYLGYSWTDQGINLDRAEAMIEKAAVLLPSDGYIVDSLGWIKYRRGYFDEAVRHLERATELRPTDPVINDHLGDAYWRAGRHNEARFQWRRARLFDPDPDLRAVLEIKLRDGLAADQAQ
jgi:Flp pilus assembly protein TadD